MTLIMLVFALGIASTAYLLHAFRAADVKRERALRSATALAQAKAALIGYALAYEDMHPGEVYGHFPCPDTSAVDVNGEGSQSPCGSQNVSVLGRLPWKTLKVSPLRDGEGECLWYAVSGTYKNNPKTPAGLTPDTPGKFLVLAADGTDVLAGPADPAVAVLFSAGAPRPGQSRTAAAGTARCGGNYVAAHYLDRNGSIDNALVSPVPNAVSTFSAAAEVMPDFNDRLLVISRADVFAAYCRKYANTLLGNVAGSANGCDGGGVATTSCSLAAGHLQNFCAQACKDAAGTFTGLPCLNDLDSQNCQSAMAELRNCRA